jgi:two-component system chemotaxis sensor kinase CheA
MTSEEPLEQMKLDFISESFDAVEKLSHDLATLDPSRTDAGRLVNALFRKAHSLKGTAGMFGLLDVGRIAGAIENVLEEVRSGRLELGPDVLEIILEGLDEIVLLLREARGEEIHADADGVIGRIEAFLGGGPEQPVTDPLEALKGRLPAGSLDELMPWETDEIVECARAGRRIVHLSIDLRGRPFTEVAAEVLPELDEFGKVLGVPPPPAVEGGDIAFALIFVVSEENGGFDLYVSGKGGRLIEASPVAAEPAGGKAGRGTGAEAPAGDSPAASRQAAGMSVKVDISQLDAVMNSISELYSVRYKLAEVARGLAAEVAGRKERDELLKLGLLLNRRITEIETAVMEARMVPVSMLFNRYMGEIRRLARKQGKTIDLVFQGEGTEIDRALLEEIYDPVLHLIRNAVDHGIEEAVERTRRGKPAKGRITLRARQESNYVRIDVEDDGAGFDLEKIEKIARAKGISGFSEDDLVSLLFEPGVSTSKEVTEISGRGVGLDEVKVHIESLRGMVNVESRPGKGTCFSLLVPLTLAVSRGVVFEEGDITAVLPLTYVEEIIPYRGKLRQQIEDAGAANTIRHGRVEAFDLAALLGVRRPVAPRSIVIVGFGEVRHAMIVGRVWGETDIATRPLPESMQVPPVIAGATELHDRRPAIIVQPEPLFRARGHAMGARRRPREDYPPDVGLGRGPSEGSFVKMGLFETGGGLTAVPLSLLSQVVPMRPVVDVPAFGDFWKGVFFERGLCHGLLSVTTGGNGGAGNGNQREARGSGSANGDGMSKIAILKFPERCGVGVSRVIGEVDVAAEKLESAEQDAGPAPVRLAAHFNLDGEKVDVLDVSRATAEEHRSQPGGGP